MVEQVDYLKEHKLIPRDQFLKLIKILVAVDNAISLQYTNHQQSPLLTTVLESGSNLANFKIHLSDFEKLLYFGKSMYQIYKLDTNLVDFTKIYIKFPTDFRDTSFVDRKRQLATSLNDWIVANQNLDFVPDMPIRTVFATSKTPKLVKNSPTKRVSKDLINKGSKFKFKEKNELIQQQKNQGLTLVERIKLKEKMANSSKVDPKVNYENYLSGKSKVIYDIIYQYMLNESNIKTFLLKKMAENVKDSLSYPLTTEEIIDVIKLMEKKLDRDTFIIVEREGLLVLKVGKLNREQDLKLLKN